VPVLLPFDWILMDAFYFLSFRWVLALWGAQMQSRWVEGGRTHSFNSGLGVVGLLAS